MRPSTHDKTNRDGLPFRALQYGFNRVHLLQPLTIFIEGSGVSLLEYLNILPPEVIPAWGELRSLDVEHIRDTVVVNCLRDDAWSSVEVAERALLRTLAALPKESFKQLGGSSDDDVHDAFFHVHRVNGDRAVVFLQMVLWTNWVFLNDVMTTSSSLSARTLATLDNAFQSMEAWIFGVSGQQESRVGRWAGRGSANGSMGRWIRGHQIFAAITQGLIAAASQLRWALQTDDEGEVDRSVEFFVTLMQGAAASLEFTGDIPTNDYVEIIRPSMTPPLVPDSFSGLLSSDHRYLVALLRDMQPLFALLHARNPIAHGRIAQAHAEIYDAHRFVCERLVGKSPSLMMASNSNKSGAEQILRFKALRMKVFEIEGASADLA